MSTPFRIDLDDFDFLFFDQLDVPGTLGATTAYGHLDQETYRATLREAAKVATDVLHPINQSGDRQGCRLDPHGNVTTPNGYKEAWAIMASAGWVAPAAPAEFGGVGLPLAAEMTVNNMFIAASTAFMMYAGLTAAAARVVARYVTASWRDVVATKLFSGTWSGTMCLTEAGAGSSVGDNRARATPSDRTGEYLLEGEKIFTSGGDNDLVDNIVHLVLARTPGSPEGTKGLSLFLVPKFAFDHEGTLGPRNGAKVVGIEHKMGINGSATCTLALGSDMPCRGFLVGDEHQGIALMFSMMNEARVAVAGQGAAMAGAAYNFALAYARERVQGVRLGARPSDGERLAIVEHPDVRRMLMSLKVSAELSRAVCVRWALDHDIAATTSDAETRERVQTKSDLLIPVLKAHCTDVGFESAVTAIQVYGGYGYIGEYPVEQLARDAKIQSIYEGTNGIQALDLLGRKMRLKQGAVFMSWLADAKTALKIGGESGFGTAAKGIEKLLDQIGASAAHLAKVAGSGTIEPAFVHAVAFQRALGTALFAMEALDQACAAQRVENERGPSAVTRGKRLNLDFFVAHCVPHGIAAAKTVLSGDVSCLDPALFSA